MRLALVLGLEVLVRNVAVRDGVVMLVRVLCGKVPYLFPVEENVSCQRCSGMNTFDLILLLISCSNIRAVYGHLPNSVVAGQEKRGAAARLRPPEAVEGSREEIDPFPPNVRIWLVAENAVHSTLAVVYRGGADLVDARTFADFVSWLLIEAAKDAKDKAIDDIAEPLWQRARKWLGDHTLNALASDPDREDWRHVLRDHIEPLLADGKRAAAIERLLFFGENGYEEEAQLQSPAAPEASEACFHFPPDDRDFANRIDERRELLEVLGRDPAPGRTTATTVVITGPPMIGKSQLAIHLAHRLKASSRYPDGSFFIDLGGPLQSSDTVADGLMDLLRAQGVSPDELPETREQALAHYRCWLTGKQALVVIENAADAEQARLFLPPDEGCAAIVTSSRSLADLDAACRCDLGPFSNADAVALLRQLDRSHRVWTAQDAHAKEIVDWCGRHPAVIARVGAWMSEPHLATLPLAEIAAQLRQGDPPRDVLGSPKLSKSLQLHDQALAQRSPEAVHLFHLLGLLDVPNIDTDVARALANLNRNALEQALSVLVDARLLEREDERDGAHFRMPAAYRNFAQDQARATEDYAECRRALERALRHYLTRDEPWTTARAGEAFDPDRISRERINLVTTVAQAFIEEFYDLTWRLSVKYARFFQAYHYFSTWEATARIGVHASDYLDQEDRHLEALAVTYVNLGNALCAQGQDRLDEAIECYEDGLWRVTELVQLGLAYMDKDLAAARSCLTWSQKLVEGLDLEQLKTSYPEQLGPSINELMTTIMQLCHQLDPQQAPS
jgi:hypothetical protein